MSRAGLPDYESARAHVRAVDRRRVGLYAVLLAMVAFYLSPLESGAMTAIKTLDAFGRTSPFAPPGPHGFTLEPWGVAWTRLSEGLVNSTLMAVPATVVSAFLGSVTAYGLTKVDWRGQVAIVMLFLAGIFIPYQSVLVPLVQFWNSVALDELLGWAPPLAARDDLIALTITHVAYGLPICTILFRGYYQTIDDELIEAARLDGASVARIYRKIVFPLSRPMFAVVLIYQFTNIWNDLLFALVLVTDPANQVVTFDLNSLKGSMVQQFNVQMAGAFIAAFPTLLVYVLFGEQFAEGVAGET